MQFKDTLRKLVLMFITAIAVFSCITVDKSLGEDYIPTEQNLAVHVAEFRLPLILKMEDSLQGLASGDSYAITGAIRTQEFGLAQFGTAANVCQPRTGFRFGSDPVIKSIYFSAGVSQTTVMENNQSKIPQDIFIHRTNKIVDTTTLYNNSITAKDYEQMTLNLSSSTYFGGDSIKVYLKNEYGTELLSATEKELDSIDLFIKRFKGLYIACSTPEEGMTGGRINNINYESASIVMKYNFQPTWGKNLPRKDTTVYLSFGSGACLNVSTYSSAHLATTNSNLKELPIEGLAGIKPFIDAKVLKAMFNKWAAEQNPPINPASIVISRARFSLPFEVPTNFDMTKYPQYLYPTNRSDNGSNIKGSLFYAPLTDINSSGNNLGAMNRSLGEYYGDFSSAIQKIMNSKAENINSKNDIWFAPIKVVQDPTYGTINYYPNTYDYSVGKINGPAAERYPKITILYSILRLN